MTTRIRIFPRIAPLFILGLPCTFCVGTVSAQPVLPNGSYGFLISATFNTPADNTGGAILGTLNFDGAGNVSGTYTFQQGAPVGGTAQTITGALTGTCANNADGTGTMTIFLDVGLSFTFSMVSYDGGQGFQLVATDSSFSLGGGSMQLRGSVQAMTGEIPATYFLGPAATGTIPIALTSTSNPGTTVYTLSNAAGNGTGSGTAQCSDGTTGTWDAAIPAFAMVFNPDFPYIASQGGGPVSGDVLMGIFGTSCGNAIYQSLAGSVNGNVGPQGGATLTIHGGGAIVAGSARAAAQTGGLSGAYGFQMVTSPLPSSVLGVMSFDGAGNVTESLTLIGSPGNGPTLAVSSGVFSGTYSVNPDGTGSMVFTSNSTGQSINVAMAFVITDNGSGLLLLGTNTGSNVRYGTARLQ